MWGAESRMSWGMHRDALGPGHPRGDLQSVTLQRGSGKGSRGGHCPESPEQPGNGSAGSRGCPESAGGAGQTSPSPRLEAAAWEGTPGHLLPVLSWWLLRRGGRKHPGPPRGAGSSRTRSLHGEKRGGQRTGLGTTWAPSPDFGVGRAAFHQRESREQPCPLPSSERGSIAGRQAQASQVSAARPPGVALGPQPLPRASGPTSRPLHPWAVTCTASLQLLLGLTSPFRSSVGEPDLGRREGAEAASPHPRQCSGSFGTALSPGTRALHIPPGMGMGTDMDMGRGRGLILGLLHFIRLQARARL